MWTVNNRLAFMIISVSQALLILLDKYKKNEPTFNTLKSLYLSGAKDKKSLLLINSYLKDPCLKKFEISRDPESINTDDSRRYFETHLAYETLRIKINDLDLTALKDHVQTMLNLINPAYVQDWGDVLNNHDGKGSARDEEYADYLSKIEKKEVFSDFSKDNREKIDRLVASSFAGVVCVTNENEYFALDIYNEGIYSDRGKQEKDEQITTTTSSFGLLKGHSPLARDDVGLMNKPLTFVKPSDRSTYDDQAAWVKNNFEKLVHPFSNSISGTVLCQLRVLLKIKQDCPSDQFPMSPETLKTYMTTLISSMLFLSGGHSLNEYTAPLELQKVQEAFADVKGFKEFNLENLFLISNQKAFGIALDKAIQYNHQLLQKNSLNEQITIITTITEDSTLPENIKRNLMSIPKAKLNTTNFCYNKVKELFNIINKNEDRVSKEYFPSMRDGSKRHEILKEMLNEAIYSLSKGHLHQAIERIEATIDRLSEFENYKVCRKKKLPEVEELRQFISKIHQEIDQSKSKNFSRFKSEFKAMTRRTEKTSEQIDKKMENSNLKRN